MQILLFVNIEQSKFTLHVNLGNSTHRGVAYNACTCGDWVPAHFEEASSPKSIPQTALHGHIREWLIMSLIIILIVGWVITAIITQNYFLLYSTPVLAELLAFTLQRIIDLVCHLGNTVVSPLSQVQKQ